MKGALVVNEELWAGPELKVQYAAFHLQRMDRSLDPPERNAWNVAIEASGAIINTGWQQVFYPHFDAFLSTARSIPEIIRCCFGVDTARVMQPWFGSLPQAEQTARHNFQIQYAQYYDAFRKLPLSNVRHIVEHRLGVPDVKVTISGQFGLIYVGSPTDPVPTSETRDIADPTLAFLAKPTRVHPRWQDFTIEGRPLFAESKDYLDQARQLIKDARRIAVSVHAGIKLTAPPS